MTKPLKPEDRKPHPKALTGPLEEQPEDLRRRRAAYRAMAILRDENYPRYLDLYWQQKRKLDIS